MRCGGGVIVAVAWKSVADDETICAYYSNIVYAYYNILIIIVKHH